MTRNLPPQITGARTVRFIERSFLMRMLSWTLALAATCFFAAIAPASAATVTYTGTGVAYDVTDLGMGEYDGYASGEVTDGVDTFDFIVSAIVNLIDPPVGDLFITEQVGGAVILDGLLESIEVGTDYVALIFGDLQGSASAMFGSKARVVFTDFAWNAATGAASVTVAPVPLPATAVLLLSGMAGVLVLSRKRKAA
jgi:hypothetical protein